MPYLAKLEKAGIPTVIVDFEDQANMVKEESLGSGVPHIRSLHASRTLPGPEDVDNWLNDALNALVEPLTEEEQEAVGRLSSRVDLSPTHAIFVYNYSDLPARAEELLAKA